MCIRDRCWHRASVKLYCMYNFLSRKDIKRLVCSKPVSYTHLDVYKRQILLILIYHDIINTGKIKKGTKCIKVENYDNLVNYCTL